MQIKEGKFRGYRNLSLHYRYWLPDEKSLRAILLVVHGTGEHSARHSNLVDYFVPKGYAVVSYDQRGHGLSEGKRSYINRFSEYLTDLKTFYDQVRGEFGNTKVFLVGHSIGGTVATAYALAHEDEFAGLILSSPGLKAGSSITKHQMLIAKILSGVLPRLGITPLEFCGLSRDEKVVGAYLKDPLVYKGKLSARFGAECLKTMENEIPRQIPHFTLPFLIMLGTADCLANPEG
jgi:acylglycerol lipase